MTEEPTVRRFNEVEQILDRITFDNSPLDFKWRFRLLPVAVDAFIGPPRDGWLLYAEFERPDALTGAIGIGRGRDEIIWAGTTESGVVKTAWVVFEMMVRHEAMHAFKYKGRPLFDPHATVERLWSISDQDRVGDTYAIEGRAT